MSSKIEVQRNCKTCGNEFTTRTTVTQYCGALCAKRASKARTKAGKIEESNKETQRIKNQSIEELKAKEFLTVREVVRLLNCSVRSTYYHIENGTIKAVNLGQRITRVKRSDIDQLFEQPITAPIQAEITPEPKQFDISEYYNLTEIKAKYGIAEATIQQLIKRNNIPKIKKGKFVYILHKEISKYLDIKEKIETQ